jgi:hypothetical protein
MTAVPLASFLALVAASAGQPFLNLHLNRYSTKGPST